MVLKGKKSTIANKGLCIVIYGWEPYGCERQVLSLDPAVTLTDISISAVCSVPPLSLELIYALWLQMHPSSVKMEFESVLGLSYLRQWRCLEFRREMRSNLIICVQQTIVFPCSLSPIIGVSFKHLFQKESILALCNKRNGESVNCLDCFFQRLITFSYRNACLVCCFNLSAFNIRPLIFVQSCCTQLQGISSAHSRTTSSLFIPQQQVMWFFFT